MYISLHSPALKTVSQIWPHSTLTTFHIFWFSELLTPGKKKNNDLDDSYVDVYTYQINIVNIDFWISIAAKATVLHWDRPC